MSSFQRQIETLTAGTPKQREQINAVNGETVKSSDPVIIRKTPVMWGIPCDEVMFSKFFTQFNKNAGVMPWDAFAIAESTYLPKARNIIHNAFLDSGMEYLAMVDSDVMFPPHSFNKLLSHKQDFINGWYKNKKDNHHPIVYDFAKEEDGVLYWKHREFPGSGVEAVDGIGLGCALMSRHVAEILGRSPYDMNQSGEDLVMCRKLMLNGIKTYVDWDVACAHLGINYA